VERQGGQQPDLLSIGERAEEIARAFRERQITTQQTLQALLEGPVREMREAEAARRSRYPHRAASEAQEWELRRRMTGILLQSGLDPERAPGVVERLLRLLRREI